MVKFVQKLDRNNKVYIAKPLRAAGLTNTVEILPNSQAAVIYKQGTPPEAVIASLQVIISDLKLRTKEKGVPKR
jgi:hypothetical protein